MPIVSGFTGFDCGTFNGGVSFNGYTSDFSFGATTVPIVDGNQTVSIGKIPESNELTRKHVCLIGYF